jgi:hypothetical protein
MSSRGNSDIIFQSIKNKEGIFGLGFSSNENLDLLNIFALAIIGIIIKISFSETQSGDSNNGPATSTIWGYGLTSIALFILIFLTLYLDKKNEQYNEKITGTFENYRIQYFIGDLINTNILPIILILCIIVYIIYLNYHYLERINQNYVTDNYKIYSFFSSLILLMQLGIIMKYVYSLLSNNDKTKLNLMKNISYILFIINLLFTIILHITLAFFSTDG